MLKAYVVNLRRRPDRRRRMLRSLPPDVDVTFTSDWPGPFDGRDLTPADLIGYQFFAWQIQSANKRWNRPMNQGQIGCALSHLACWRDAWERGLALTLFLEDDVALADDFWAALPAAFDEVAAADPDWDLCYLGRLPMQLDQPVGGRIVRPGFSYCPFAYAVRRSGLEKLLNAGFDQALIPVDEFIPAMYMDHPRADVRRRYSACLRAYAFDPPLAFQVDPPGADSAIDASELGEEAAPLATSALMAAATAEFEAGKHEQAAERCEIVLTQEPENADAHHVLGLVAYARGDYAGAEELLRRAVRLAGEVPRFHSNLGLALYQQGRLDEAVESHRRALAIDPGYAGARNNIGMIMLDRSEIDEASKEFEGAVESDPSFAEAHNNLGLALRRRGDLTRATEQYRRAIELKPSLVAAYTNLGDVLLEGGSAAEAATAYEDALNRHPDLAIARHGLAAALRTLSVT